MKITRHFVTVGNRRVHYLRAGNGPVVAMLHACPVSAKVMRPLMQIFARRFTCLAFDMPGFGLSDPLPLAQPSIEDFADALEQTLSALGIEHVTTYGRHTGASIAVEFAARHPERCVMSLADGYAVFARPYNDEELERYLEPIVPAWDGAHLLRLWFRYRDQHVFWPWNAQDDAHRSDTDVPSPDYIHRGVVELLEAGNGYRVGYRAPFRHRGLAVIADLKVPVCFGNRPGDSMYKTRPMYPQGIWDADVPREFAAASEMELELLCRVRSEKPAPPPAECVALPGRTTDRYLDVDGAQVLVRSVGDLRGGRTPLLLIHHAPGSSALYQPLLLELSKSTPVLAIDLPGHGESEPLPGNPQSVASWTDSAIAVLDQLGIKRVHAAGHNAGAAVALELAVGRSERVSSVTLDSPFFLSAEERALFAAHPAPSIEPDPEGLHLLRAWHHLRDAEMWWPWFRREKAFQSPRPSRLDPSDLSERLLAAIKQPASYAPAWRAIIQYPWESRLRACNKPLLALAASDDLACQRIDAVAKLAGVRGELCDRGLKASRIEQFIRGLES
jgi:pimeloyl-ACP methyl ester carboxylesterase